MGPITPRRVGSGTEKPKKDPRFLNQVPTLPQSGARDNTEVGLFKIVSSNILS